MSNLEMKKCKECGSLFMPTSNKQKYCSAKHHRPCPVCGKMIFAKYLSDPARCCSGKCKAVLSKMNRQNNSILTEQPKISEFDQAIQESCDKTIEYASLDAEAVEEAFTRVNRDKITEGTVRKKFVGSEDTRCIKDHEYAVSIEYNTGANIVYVAYDYTEEKLVGYAYNYTNKKKISKDFRSCK